MTFNLALQHSAQRQTVPSALPIQLCGGKGNNPQGNSLPFNSGKPLNAVPRAYLSCVWEQELAAVGMNHSGNHQEGQNT